MPTNKEIKDALAQLLPDSDHVDDIDELQTELEDHFDVGDLKAQRKLIEEEVKAYKEAAKVKAEEEESGKRALHYSSHSIRLLTFCSYMYPQQ